MQIASYEIPVFAGIHWPQASRSPCWVIPWDHILANDRQIRSLILATNLQPGCKFSSKLVASLANDQQIRFVSIGRAEPPSRQGFQHYSCMCDAVCFKLPASYRQVRLPPSDLEHPNALQIQIRLVVPLSGFFRSILFHSTRLTTTAVKPRIAKIIGTPMQSDFLIVFQLILDGVIRVWFAFW